MDDYDKWIDRLGAYNCQSSYSSRSPAVLGHLRSFVVNALGSAAARAASGPVYTAARRHVPALL